MSIFSTKSVIRSNFTEDDGVEGVYSIKKTVHIGNMDIIIVIWIVLRDLSFVTL